MSVFYAVYAISGWVATFVVMMGLIVAAILKNQAVARKKAAEMVQGFPVVRDK